jgi:hypothetical protein
MRIMIACLAAVAAVAFAAPSFAQEAAPAAPTAKPKVGTAAYCNTLKTTSSKASCLKRVQASVAKPATPPVHKAKAKKPTTDTTTTVPKETSAAATPPTPTPVQQAQPSTIVVPPLPQKTI